MIRVKAKARKTMPAGVAKVEAKEKAKQAGVVEVAKGRGMTIGGEKRQVEKARTPGMVACPPRRPSAETNIVGAAHGPTPLARRAIVGIIRAIRKKLGAGRMMVPNLGKIGRMTVTSGRGLR